MRNQIQLEPPYPLVTITSYDQVHSIGGQLGQTAPASAAWPAIDRAVFVPFVLYRPATAYSMFIVNGAAVSGNIDLGIYDHTGKLLASIGSTAQAGTNDIQEIDFAAPLNLGPGYFFMAISIDNTTATVLRRTLGNNEGRAAGAYQDGGAFPLPDPATLGTISSSNVPLMGVRFRD